VLVVDDAIEHARLVAGLLQSAGGWPDAVVDIAESYEKGLARARATEHDVAVFDYWLGAQSGVGLLRELRQDGVTTPVIVLTGQGDEGIAVEAMKAGASDYLSKGSLTAESLARAVRHTLALRAEEEQRRRAEAALRASDERLREAQKMEAVGQLAGGIAHDFNNLLTAILGYCNLLLEEIGEDSRIRHDLLEIRTAGERAAQLTRQLLAFGRRQMLQPRRVDVNALVADAEPMLRSLAAEGIEVVLALSPGLPSTRIDPASFEQVLVHLAMNARDAMPAGGRLIIETHLVDLESAYALAHTPVVSGRYIMLAVSDSGEGMDAATRARVFEPFFTTKEMGKGTGMGLATVYGIVKQSGGYIWAYSEPGHGTVFKVYLRPADLPEFDDVTPRGDAALGRETVLLVENDERVRMVAGDILRLQGYLVLQAVDGAQALDLVAQYPHTIDLLLSDVVMPRMSGPTLAARLRERRPRLKVVFMSGYTQQGVVYGDLPSGVAFVQKPFTPEVLARTVRGVLDDAPTARQS
jgi:signal transduction histidine kinase